MTGLMAKLNRLCEVCEWLGYYSEEHEDRPALEAERDELYGQIAAKLYDLQKQKELPPCSNPD